MATVFLDTPITLTPASYGDYVDIDPTAYIPASATGVKLKLKDSSSPTNRSYHIRCKNSTDDRYSILWALGQTYGTCKIDDDQLFQVKFETSGVFMLLVGYTEDEVVLYTNAVDISLGTTGSYQDIDINVNDGAISAIVELFVGAASNVYLYCIRKNGSTDDRYYNRALKHGVFGYEVGLDENEIFEAKIENTGLDFFLHGYYKSGITMATNATDVSLGSTGSYIDIDAGSDIGGALLNVINNYQFTPYSWGVRKNGYTGSPQIEGYGNGLESQCVGVGVDTDGIFEGEIANTYIDFYLIGTYDLPETIYGNWIGINF